MLTKKMKRVLKHCGKLNHENWRRVNWRAAVCDENAAIRSCLDRNTIDGKIGVIVQGMDCDCCAYRREYVTESWSSVAAFKKHWSEHCDYLDGPETQNFCQPTEVEKCNNYSRDLALEAYENGHPHRIEY